MIWAMEQKIFDGDFSPVTLTTTDEHAQVQQVQIGSSLGAGNATALYFGLGQQTIQSLEIRWPNGSTQTYQDVPANMHYNIHLWR